MEANTAMLEDALTMKPFSSCWSEGDQGNPNGMVAGKPQKCAFYLGFTAL